MSWGMYGHYIVSRTISINPQADISAIGPILLYVNLLVRYPSGLGWTSCEPHAGSNVPIVEELPLQIPRKRQYHPSGFHRCHLVVLCLCTSCLALPAREASETIHLLVGGFRCYLDRTTRLGSQ